MGYRMAYRVSGKSSVNLPVHVNNLTVAIVQIIRGVI